MKHFKKKHLLLAIMLTITSVFTSIQPLTANAVYELPSAVIDVNSFQSDVKKIVNPDVGGTWDYTDTAIKHIIFEKNNNEVSDTVLDHNNRIQSPDKSPYVSFDATTGTLKIWTNGRFGVQNAAAGAHMFNKLSALESVEGFELLDLSGANLTNMFRGVTNLKYLSVPTVTGSVNLPNTLYDANGNPYTTLNSSIPVGTVLSSDYKPAIDCAILPEGQTFCSDAKSLANWADTTYTTDDFKIKHIKFICNQTDFTDYILMDPDYYIYAKFENDTLTVATQCPRMVTNTNVNAMFRQMKALEDIEGLVWNDTISVFALVFYQDSALASVDLSTLSITPDTNINTQWSNENFSGCSSLNTIVTPKSYDNAYGINLPVALYDESGNRCTVLNNSTPASSVLSLNNKPIAACAVLPKGQTFCTIVKTLANGTSTDYLTDDTAIQHIKFVCNQTDFTGYTLLDANYDIYAKFESGTLTVATRCPRMVTNSDTNSMFRQMKSLEDVDGLVWNDTITTFASTFLYDSALTSVDLSTLSITPDTNINTKWAYENFFGCSSLGTIVTPKSYDNEYGMGLPATYYYSDINDIFAAESFNNLQKFRSMELVKNWNDYNLSYCLTNDANKTFIAADLSEHNSDYFSSETYLNELRDYCNTVLQNSNLYLEEDEYVSGFNAAIHIHERMLTDEAMITSPNAGAKYTLIDKSSYAYEVTDVRCYGLCSLNNADGDSYYMYTCYYKIKNTNYTGSMNVYVGEIPNYYGTSVGRWSSDGYDLSKLINLYEPTVDFDNHLMNVNMKEQGSHLINYFIPLTNATESATKEETTSVFEQIRNFHSDYSYEVLNETLADVYYLDIGNTDINSFKNMLTIKDDATNTTYELWSDDYTDYPIYIDDQNRPYYKVDTGTKKESVNVAESNLDDAALDAIESSVEDATDISSKVYDVTYSVVTEDTNGNVVSSETVTDLSDDSVSADVAKVYIKLDNYSADDGLTRVITHIHNGTNDTYTYTDNLTDTDMTHYTIEDGYAVLNMSTFSPVVVTTYKSAVKTPANTPTNTTTGTTTGDTGSTSGTNTSQTSDTTTTENTSDTTTAQTGDKTNSETTTSEDNSGSTTNTTSNTTDSTSSDTSTNTSTDTTNTTSQTTTTDTTDDNDTKTDDTVSDNSQSQTQSADETVSNNNISEDTKDTVVTTSSNSNLTEESDNCDKKDSDITTSLDSSEVEDEEIADTGSSSKNTVNSSHANHSYDSRIVIAISLILLLLIVILILWICKKKSKNK